MLDRSTLDGAKKMAKFRIITEAELPAASPMARKECFEGLRRSRILRSLHSGLWKKLCAEFGSPEMAVKVGDSVATISAGPDQKFGTDDDEVSISEPAKMPYAKMLKDQLLEECEKRGLPLSGETSDLIERLEESDRK